MVTVVTGWDVHGMWLESQIAAINMLNADEIQNKDFRCDILKINHLNHYDTYFITFLKNDKYADFSAIIGF